MANSLSPDGLTVNSINDGQIGGRRNLIINGAMQVAQRGTTSTSTGHQTVDRFHNIAITDGIITQSQTAITSGSPYDEGFRNVYRQKATTASANPAAAHYLGMVYKFEGQDLVASNWDYTSSSSNLTLSFWARSSVAGTYTCSIRSDDGTQKDQSFEYTLTANTWKKITHTVTGNSGITINSDNSVGLSIFFWQYLGTSYTASSHTYDTWATYDSTSQADDYAQNWMTTSNATFDITGVQLEVGEENTAFEHRSFGEELYLCQRYFFGPTGRYANGAIGSNTNYPRCTSMSSFPVTMRATPTVTFESSNPQTSGKLERQNGTDSGTATAVVDKDGIHYFFISGESSFNNAYNKMMYQFGNLKANAEL